MERGKWKIVRDIFNAPLSTLHFTLYTFHFQFSIFHFLKELQHPEEVGTMEIRCFHIYRIPGEEVRSL